MNKAIVLLSGGMDSLVTAAIAVRDNEEVNFLHANYGQRTEDRELACFEALCDHYRPRRKMAIDLTWMSQIGGSALTDLSMQIKDHDGSLDVPNTYVPYRNANLIGAAVSWAEVIGANRIYVGAVEEDSSGYPDCREVFFAALQKTIEYGTNNAIPVEIVTPVIHMNKSQIILLGAQLGAPFEHSWSCYRNSDAACGTCDSCTLRLRAFAALGMKDPIPYKKD
ncbi:MAG: 7-cyano-7-deazaguanine synthase QueC [Candidatus Cloacimonetes bacterium HGW-Cloacimonetes-1]|jgi:7-cyano-7-deazaguanine synthase|nr:MAG: 7-cyano-7-deazaguanine synthase QueC [Candidatus Cloacimonetes bacterium HGW-Cloacimonetes-1]